MAARDVDRVGRVASIRYVGGVAGEEPLDNHAEGEPLRVILGERRVPKGIEDALYEMEVGEIRTIEIPCELGYGLRDESRVQWYPRTMVDNGYKAHVGDVLRWSNPHDMSYAPVWVTAETEDTIQLDFNHPFAGKTLSYRVELVDLR